MQVAGELKLDVVRVEGIMATQTDKELQRRQ